MKTAAVVWDPAVPTEPKKWWPSSIQINTWEEWIEWWDKRLPRPFHLQLLDAIFTDRKSTPLAVRFLVSFIEYHHSRQVATDTRLYLQEVRYKAIEMLMLRFLKEKDDPWNVDPLWAEAFVDDPQLFAVVLHCLAQHNRDFSSEQYHYRSIVKKFLKRCVLLHGWGHSLRSGTKLTEFEVIREADIVEFYRTLFVWEMGGLITRLDEASLKAVETLTFEAGEGGDRPKTVEEAIEPPADLRLSELHGSIPTCQRAAAWQLLHLRIKVKAEKRNQRIARKKERERRKELRRGQRQG